MMMISRKGLSEVLNLTMDATYKRIATNRVPQFDYYDYDKREMWHESTVMKMIAEIERERVDYDKLVELAKTSTIPEISRALDITEGRIKWFCKQNQIDTKSRTVTKLKGRGSKVKTKQQREITASEEQKKFNNILKTMRVKNAK